MARKRKRESGNKLIGRRGLADDGLLGQTLVNQEVATDEVGQMDWPRLMNEVVKEQLSKRSFGFIIYIIEHTTLRIHENIIGFLHEDKNARASREIWEARYESYRHLSGRARIC